MKTNVRFAAACVALLGMTSPAADSVDRVASMRDARSVHTATTLGSGEVLMVGGMRSGGGMLASAELFDPARNVSTRAGSLADARSGHSATLLPDGRVVVAGGYNGDYLASIEVYDPATKRFRRAGSLVEGRSGATATLLRDGRILFAGGVGRGWTFLRSAEIYDPATGRSRAVGSMSVPRESHVAELLADGRVLVVGGHNGRRQAMAVFASAELFSPGTGRFELTGAMRTPRHKHDAVTLRDGRVLVIGGADRTDRRFFSSTEIYDPSTGRFTPGPAMSSARYKIAETSVRLPSSEVLVPAGAREVEILDSTARAFRRVPGALPDGFLFAATASLPDGDVVIAGGYAGSSAATDGIWRFHRR